MISLGIKELKDNPSALTKALEHNEPSLFTKHGKPIGIALSWSDEIIKNGYRQSIAIDAFKAGSITLSQLAVMLETTKERAFELLGKLGVCYVDYDEHSLEKELDSLLA